MAGSALYAPSHRIMGRVTSGGFQPPTIAPSVDAVCLAIQDARWQWNTGSSANAPQVIGWPDPGMNAVLDVLPFAANPVAIAPAQVPVLGQPMQLSQVSAGDVEVLDAPMTLLPGMAQAPAGSVFIHTAGPGFHRFGGNTRGTWLYDRTRMIARELTITSVGDDSSVTLQIIGIDLYGYMLIQNVIMPNATMIRTGKAFQGVISAIPYFGALSGQNVSIGFSDTFGLPFFVPTPPPFSQLWGYYGTQSIMIPTTGTIAPGDPNVPDIFGGSDVRGTWTPATPFNGTTPLALWMRPAIGVMATLGINKGMFGQPQMVPGGS